MRNLLIAIAILTVAAFWVPCGFGQADQPGQAPPTAESTMTDTGAAKANIPEKMPASNSTKAAKAGKSSKAVKAGEAMSPDKGIGPIKNITLGAIDPKLADQGKSQFNSVCTACHNLDKKLVGPPLREITERRTPEYIMNMLLNTQEMQDKDPEVIKLIKEYKVLMAIPKLTQDQARALLEYLRQADQEKPKK